MIALELPATGPLGLLIFSSKALMTSVAEIMPETFDQELKRTLALIELSDKLCLNFETVKLP